MTWIAEFFFSNWKLVLIGLLSAALLLSIKVGNGIRVDYETDKLKWSIQVAQAEAAQQEVADRSMKTLETINANHKAILVTAQANATANYKRILASVGQPALRMPASAGQTLGASSGSAGSASAPDETGTVAMVDPVERIVTDCAATTVMAQEFQQWVRGNHLPVEGE